MYCNQDTKRQTCSVRLVLDQAVDSFCVQFHAMRLSSQTAVSAVAQTCQSIPSCLFQWQNNQLKVCWEQQQEPEASCRCCRRPWRWLVLAWVCRCVGRHGCASPLHHSRKRDNLAKDWDGVGNRSLAVLDTEPSSGSASSLRRFHQRVSQWGNRSKGCM